MEKSDEKDKKLPAEQGKSEVGHKKPPKEHQFKSGQSGNPKGPPIRRTNLWLWFCRYMEMTDKKLEKLNRNKLTQAQQAAMKLVDNMKSGKKSGSQRLALSVFDREEGRAVEHLVFETEDALSDTECEEIKEVLRGNNVD